MTPDTPADYVVDGFADFAGYIPAVVAAAIAVSLAIWGTKRLVALFRSLAK